MNVQTVRPGLEQELREVFMEHDLHLLEVTYKKNLAKNTLNFSLKVVGDLDEQLQLLNRE